MDSSDNLLRAALKSDEEFRTALRRALEVHGLTVQELARRSGTSASTLYKVINEDRSPSLGVLRRLIRALREQEAVTAGNFIAVVAARHVLDEVIERSVQIGEETVRVRDYPAATVEDAIVAAIRAEREGAVAVVCAPIVSATIERILSIPIATIVPRDSVTEAIKVAARKSKG